MPLSPGFSADIDTGRSEFVVVSAEHAPELKTLCDRAIATKFAAQPFARIVDFQLSGGGNGALFECTLYFVDAVAPDIPGDGESLVNASFHFFEASRGQELQDQLERFRAASAGDAIRGLCAAGGGAGAVLMVGVLLDTQQAQRVKTFDGGTAILVAGTVTVAANLSDDARPWVQLLAPIGTLGVAYKVDALVAGVPGSFDITAVDAAGATVVADISVLQFFVINARLN